MRDCDSVSQRQRKGLLRKKLNWCRDNYDLIDRRVLKVYTFFLKEFTEAHEAGKPAHLKCGHVAGLRPTTYTRMGLAYVPSKSSGQ